MALVGGAAPEIAHQPGAEALRLADVDDLTARSEHAIDAGTIGRFGADVLAHDLDLFLGRRRPEQL
jgi:hypothetical protein